MYTTKKPYLIDAIVGNSRFLASLGRTGRMYRLWWPHIDYPQHVDEIRSGLHIEGTTPGTTWFDGEEDGWRHEASYVPRTNMFKTTAVSERFPLSAETVDYAVPGEDFVVRQYTFTNRGETPVSFRFMYYSSFRSMETPFYHTTQFDEAHDSLMHLRHEYIFSVSSSNVCTEYQAGANVWENAQTGHLNGHGIDMKPDGALCWHMEKLEPGAAVEVPVYIAAGQTRAAARQSLAKAKSRPHAYWYAFTESYWHQFLNGAAPAPGSRSDICELYERSLLAMKLMSDEKSGSVVAAPEFDEQFSRCGGYSYCWGRDAAFITTALDRVGLTELSAKFYEWTLTAQDPDGSWQQRHYHDGRLAPSWGLQIDEGASIIWGMWQHYLQVQDDAFLHNVWPAVERGARFLAGYIDAETGLPACSMDLWEERFAEHTYSAGAVFGGLTAAASFAERLGKPELASEWSLAAKRIRQSIGELCWNEEKGAFYRALKLAVPEAVYREAQQQALGTSVSVNAKGYTTYFLEHDPIVDISLIGISVPFGVFPADDPRVVRTADTIEQYLTSPVVGGIKRYENDHYIGGNPWILTTLWLCHYRIHRGQYAEAKSLLQWAIDHRTAAGLLPEQVDKQTGETAWVVPLTWSHAMFILAVTLLAEHGQLD